MRFLGCLILLVGCHIGGAVVPDTPDDPGDGSQRGLGIFVDWRAEPSLPGTLTDEITVSEAMFQVDHFQLLADAGSVTRARYLLTWDAESEPQQDAFPDAPPGVYSKVALVMMGGNLGEDAFRIRGTWRDNDLTIPFEVSDINQLSISLDCDETLPAGGSASVAIRLDLRDAISGIDFTSLGLDDGVLELKDGPGLITFRSRLQQAFTLDN
jgi:hypothetical protein